MRMIIKDRNVKEESLQKELHSVKVQLNSTLNHNKLIREEVSTLKQDFKQKENKLLEEFLDMKHLKEKVEDKLYKQDQSLQTVHMLCKPKSFYDEVNRVAIGYNNPFYLSKAKQVQPALYNGHEIVKPNHDRALVHDLEDTLEIAETTRKQMIKKNERSRICEKEEAEVDQNAIYNKCDEIERKNILIENENLIVECLSKDVFYTATNSVLTVSRFSDMHDAYTVAQKHIAELEAKNSNLTQKIQKDDHDEMIKHFSKLEVEHLNLQLKYQHLKERCGNKKSVTSSDAPAFDSVFVIENLKEQLNGRGNTIRDLKETISRLKKKHSVTDPILDFKALDSQKKDLTVKVNALQNLNEHFRAANKKVKHHYKELYDSYVESLEKEIDELESDKADFSNMYDLLLQECVSKDVMCSYLHFLSDLDAHTELQCLYLYKVKECKCLAQKLSTQTKTQCQEQIKNDTVCKQNRSTVFLKECEQYHEIQDLKAQLKDKNIAIRVIHKTSVSRPQLRSTQMKEKVMQKNSQVKFKKTEVEDQHRISSISNKIKSVTAYNDSLKSRTSNVNDVCATCGKCLFNSNHDACVSKFLNDVNARTKKPKIVQLILFIVDSGCTKHMTGNLKLLCNFVEKHLGTVYFGNDQISLILGYGDLVEGNITIKRVYYIKGLNHNLFSVGESCDADVEKKTSPTPVCFTAKALATQAWLWHRRISHLNFDYINLLSKKDIMIGLPKLKYVKDQLCSSCEVSKVKRSSFKTKVVPSSKGRLNLLHMDLCGPMRVESINWKKYIRVIVDDYSRYTWTLFLRSKDETPEVLKDFLKMIQRNLQAQVITVRTDRGIKFLNKTLTAYFKEEGIEHQTSTP
ncbi:retrovirus-related pol polyprotein from transposon TNT 1-94 [Tanacetum coccineum]